MRCIRDLCIRRDQGLCPWFEDGCEEDVDLALHDGTGRRHCDHGGHGFVRLLLWERLSQGLLEEVVGMHHET